MAGRRGRGRALDPETALRISLDGTSRRVVGDKVPVLDAVAQLRAMADGRTDLLGSVAGGLIGFYLSHPLASPLALPAAYLLVLAGGDKEHAALVAAANETRHVVGGGGYSLRTGPSKPNDRAEQVLPGAQAQP
jgi:hypothetical protein